MKLILYMIYCLSASILPGGNNSIGKNIRSTFQRLLGIKLGNNSVIGHHTKISYRALGKITLGNESGIGPYSFVLGTGEVFIKDYVICAPKVTFITRWHDISFNKDGKRENIQKEGKIIIGNNVFIGTNVTILPNVTIGDNSIISSGTVVYKSIPANSFAKSAKLVIDNVGEKK